MADQAAFGEEEWAAVLRAPFLIGLLIATASPSGMLGSLREAFAAKKLLIETRANGTGVNSLIDLVLAELDTDEGRSKADLMHLANLTPADARKEAERSIQLAGEAARAHAPAEATGFLEWLLTLAHAVASASKEGGFLGIGGTPVSNAEASALEKIRELLLGRSVRDEIFHAP